MDQIKHTNLRLESELGALGQQVQAMGGLVDAQVSEAVAALTARDRERAQRVVEADRAVDQMELAIDERCIRILALQQPAASDLRFVAAVLKMVTDLERIGDLAVNMAERIPAMCAETPLRAVEELPGLAAAAQAMLRDALEAFVAGDAGKAAAVRAADDKVDAWTARLYAELEREMAADGTRVARGLATIFFAKHVERVADHATNVAEMVTYLVRGEDVRHSQGV
jgi:phosphate transport system protein